MNVGTKELENRLSHYLRLVRNGATVTVMDRGKVVAQLVPVLAARNRRDEEALRELERDGVITRATRRPRDIVPVRARATRAVSAMITEDRG